MRNTYQTKTDDTKKQSCIGEREREREREREKRETKDEKKKPLFFDRRSLFFSRERAKKKKKKTTIFLNSFSISSTLDDERTLYPHIEESRRKGTRAARVPDRDRRRGERVSFFLPDNTTRAFSNCSITTRRKKRL